MNGTLIEVTQAIEGIWSNDEVSIALWPGKKDGEPNTGSYTNKVRVPHAGYNFQFTINPEDDYFTLNMLFEIPGKGASEMVFKLNDIDKDKTTLQLSNNGMLITLKKAG